MRALLLTLDRGWSSGRRAAIGRHPKLVNREVFVFYWRNHGGSSFIQVGEAVSQASIRCSDFWTDPAGVYGAPAAALAVWVST